MSDAVLVAMIGLGSTIVGAVVGAVGMVLAARIQAAHRAGQVASSEQVETTPVRGVVIDTRELRILRALFGEPRGRRLEGYTGQYYGQFYGPFLEAVITKGWVKQIGNKYYLTSMGADFCRAYLREQIEVWQPTVPSRSD